MKSCRSNVIMSGTSCDDVLLLGQTLWLKSPSNHSLPKKQSIDVQHRHHDDALSCDVITLGTLLCDITVWALASSSSQLAGIRGEPEKFGNPHPHMGTGNPF